MDKKWLSDKPKTLALLEVPIDVAVSETWRGENINAKIGYLT